MKFIDLCLSSHDNKDTSHYSLHEAIEKDNIVVVLGSPGSGKTSLLEKYKSQTPDTQLLKVNQFIKLENKVAPETKILLLDGLDEYRSVTQDKTFVMSEVGSKINALDGVKIVISCRSLDWYGETDQASLEEQVDKKAEVYSVLALEVEQKRELASLLGVTEIDTFLNKFSKYGFLDNPQMFTMVAKLFKENPDDILESKKALYETFIKNAREHNPTHKRATKQLEPEEILKYTGYLASYYMFSSVDVFDEKFVDSICDSEKGYGKEVLEATLKTTLFDDKSFIHRTIAEFSLAYFLVNHKLKDSAISKSRLKALFVENAKVPTELRSVYAWICSLSGDEEFIAVDPYYQIVYGDNSYFSDDLKKKIVLSVRDYAKTNPYFIDFRSTRDIEGFYVNKLGDFLVDELRYALKQKTHYSFFLINIFKSTKMLDEKVKNYLKSVIADNSIESYVRDDLVEIFKDDINFLKELLQQIKDGKVKDSGDEIKEAILRILYPIHITHEQIAEYIMLYKNEVGGYCYYLDDTPYHDKYNLVDSIHKQSYKKKEEHNHLLLPKNADLFISDYFLETLLKYKQGLSAEDIYDIIKHFRQYYDRHQNIKFQSFRQSIIDAEKRRGTELIELTNSLYSLYIDEILLNDDTQQYDFYNFIDFFDYINPTDVSDMIFSKINQKLDTNKNEALFFTALSYTPRDKHNKVIVTEKINKLVKKYSLEDRFDKYQNPPIYEWEKKQKKRQEKEEAENKKIRDENEKYFSSKSDKELQSSFETLNYIEQFYFIENTQEKALMFFEKETFERLTNILKNAIYSPLIEPIYLSLKSLAKDAPQASRHIDRIYFTSVYLNKGTIIKIDNIEFLKYLYINTLMNSHTGNINHGDLIEQIEERDLDFAMKTLKEYIGLLFDNYLPNYKKLFWSYIEKEELLEELKNIAMIRNHQQSYEEGILKNCLSSFHFNLALDDLLALEKVKTSDENHKVIVALKTLHEQKRDKFTINMAIRLHSLFDYHHDRFKNLETNLRVRVIDYMMNQFDTEESIKSVNGFQSSKNMCASFLRHDSLTVLNLQELQSLQKLHRDETDIWYPRIANKISELQQQDRDQTHEPLSIEKIKNFIFSDDIVSVDDFYTDVVEKIKALKTEIEDNRNNDKEPFYNSDKSSKKEDACRDVIMQRLKDKYGKDLDITKEKHEANNRVDINIRYKANQTYEVQIECKKDANSSIYKGIQEQLIDKYFSSGVQYGIYLIFYFGRKKDKEVFLDKVQKSLPVEFREKIEIICIDLHL
jgi:energy-coupling factor transporter ATP-binding protein EcfA2